MKELPTPHLEKIHATLANEKLPEADKPLLEKLIERHQKWVEALDAVTGIPDKRLREMVALLNEYRLFLDLEIIFDSKLDFLYRQKGQLKLDNSVIEEFLPRLIHPAILPEIKDFQVVVGPTTCFSSVYFGASLDVPELGGGLSIRTKAQ